MRLRWQAGAALAALVLACSPAAALHGLGAMNETTIDLAVWVNGREVAQLAPGNGMELQESAGPLPWRIEVRTVTSGRLVAFTTIDAEELLPQRDERGLSAETGSLFTVDTPCGRVQVWTGGPAVRLPAPPPTTVEGRCVP